MPIRLMMVVAIGLLAGAAVGQDAPQLKTDKEKLSYAIGVEVANNLRKQLVEVDVDLMIVGVRDALSGRQTLLPEPEVRALMNDLQNELKRKASAIADIQFSYKLDRRLTQGLYMGERWVSPPTYVGAAAQDTVDVRAYGLDGRGLPKMIRPEWIVADPEMVTVSRSEGNEVKITVKRPGQTTVRVTSDGVSKELSLKAAYQNNVMQLEITQGQ